MFFFKNLEAVLEQRHFLPHKSLGMFVFVKLYNLYTHFRNDYDWGHWGMVSGIALPRKKLEGVTHFQRNILSGSIDVGDFPARDPKLLQQMECLTPGTMIFQHRFLP